MESEEKCIYTVMLAVCIILSAFLIGKMVLHTDVPLHDPHTVVQRAGETRAEDGREVALDGERLTSLVIRQLPADCPLDSLTVGIGADGSLLVTASAARDALQSLAELPAGTAALLPAACTVSAALSVGLDREAGAIVLEPVSVSVNGLRLPAALLKPAVGLLETALQDGLRAQGVTFASVRTEDGKLSVGV